jgi:serine/threonine protein kinase
MLLGDGRVALVDLGLAVKAPAPSSPRKPSSLPLESDAASLLAPRTRAASPFALPSPSLSALSRSPPRGRPCYACPEGVRQRGRVEAYGGDVWCLGVLLFYSLLGLPSCPLTAMDLLCGAHLGSSGEGGGVEALVSHYLRQFAGRAAKNAPPPELTSAVKELLGGMLCPDPSRRLSIEQVRGACG